MRKAEVPFKSSGEVNNFSGRQSGDSSPAATPTHSTNFPNQKQATCTLNQMSALCGSLSILWHCLSLGLE